MPRENLPQVVFFSINLVKLYLFIFFLFKFVYIGLTVKGIIELFVYIFLIKFVGINLI